MSRTTKAMAGLSLEVPSTTPAKFNKKDKDVAESWEDESSGDETPVQAATKSGFEPPPPTPNSPLSANIAAAQNLNIATGVASGRGPGGATMMSPVSPIDTSDSRRPEKTDAVARRMIASALGVKAPKATEEQKAYDRAIREAERKRREEEREALRRKEEETARAKAAIWND